MLAFVSKLLIIVLALLVVSRVVPGITVNSFYTACIVAVILGLINLTVRPILSVLTLPITILSFGFFALILNALLLWFVGSFVEGFHVSSFMSAFIGSLIISLFSWLGNRFL